MPRTRAEERILEKERSIKLSASSAETVFALMENPPEPNENLKNAMRLHAKLFSYDGAAHNRLDQPISEHGCSL